MYIERFTNETGESRQIMEQMARQTKQVNSIVVRTTKKRKGSFVSLTKRLNDQPDVLDSIIDFCSALKISKLKRFELTILMIVAKIEGVQYIDIENLNIFRSIDIMTTFVKFIQKGYIVKDEQGKHHLTSLGAYTLRSCLPSFTFPLPRY